MTAAGRLDPESPPALDDWSEEGVLLRARRLAGLVAAPVVCVLIWSLALPGLKPEAHRLAGITAGVVVLWFTESLPLPLTGLLGASACVAFRVAPVKDVFAPFADPLIFLFIGSFILARAIFLHGLDRRLAFGILSLSWIGARPARILFAYGAVTAFISAWISNAATTAMMIAIGLSLVAFLDDPQRTGGVVVPSRYATGLILMTSFAASVGGFATPIGAAPNLIGLGFLREELGIDFTFWKFSAVGVPLALGLFLYVALYLGLFCRAGIDEIPNGRETIRRERDRLGPWTPGQRSTVVACAVTVSLWLAPAAIALTAGETSALAREFNRSIPEPVAAVIGAGLLFVLPGGDGRGRRAPAAMTWEEASRIDWGVILLFGGGLSLGGLSFQTGLADSLGHALTAALPDQGQSGFALLCASTFLAMVVSEVTSNTASATMVVPVVIAVARAAGVDALEPVLGATFGSGLGFMLPVSTPPNAIVFASGRIPLRTMIAYGLMLDAVGVVVVIVLVRTIVPLVR